MPKTPSNALAECWDSLICSIRSVLAAVFFLLAAVTFFLTACCLVSKSYRRQ